MKRLPIVIVNETGKENFQNLCSKMVEDGYILSSSSCGFVNSKDYNFQDIFQAIFVLPCATIKEKK
jgi:hypothetical protein